MSTPEIEELKSLIQQKYGQSLNTSTDFEQFTLEFEKTTEEKISASTLKRMWGYVGDAHKTRVATLDSLSRYLSFENFYDFTHWLKTSTRYNSSFFDAKQLASSELSEGDMVEIGWSPNRRLLLRYLGDSNYEVVTSENSKLLKGDRFLTGCFIREQPLYLPYVIRKGERTAPFVAGRNGGLSIVNIVK